MLLLKISQDKKKEKDNFGIGLVSADLIMLQTLTIITVVVYAISIILHLLGFSLLTRVRKTDIFGETQRMYLLNLSLTSAIYAGLAIAEEICLNFSEWRSALFYVTLIMDGFFYTWYIFVMTALTFDRFLTLYLKLKYISVWRKSKTLTMLFISFTSSGLITLVLYLSHTDVESLLASMTLYVWPMLDFMFLFVAFFTYGYLIKTFNNKNNVGVIVQARIPGRISSSETPVVLHQQENNTTPPMLKPTASFCLKKARRGFVVPSLLVSTFVVCWLIPDLIYFGYELYGKELKHGSIVDLLYPVGVLSDAIIYILCWKDTRQLLMKLLFCKP